MGLDVDSAEVHASVAPVIVNGEVGKARVAALANLAVDKGRGERPVSVLARNVIGTEFGGLDVLNQQPQGGTAAHDAGAKNGAVFIAISREQMLHDSVVVPGGHEDVALGSRHWSCSRKCSTLTNLARAVCG